jgi:nitrogen fixation protein
MTLLSPIPFPGSPVILEEFDADYFEVVGSQLRTKAPAATTNALAVVGTDLTSTVNGVAATISLASLDKQQLSIAGQVISLTNGGSVTLPAIPATTNAATFDVLSNKLTITVNGVVAVVDLGSLDDEGVTMAFSAGNLVLKSKAGTVLSTTPIPDLDAQQLTGAVASGAYKLTLTNGGSVTIDSTQIGSIFADGTATPADKVLVKGGTAVSISSLPISPSQLTAGPLPANVQISAASLPPTTVSNAVAGAGLARTISTTVNGVTGAPVAIPDTDAQALSIAGNVISLSNGGSVTLPAIPATTNTLALTPAGVLTSTVNGVAANVTIPPINCAAIKAAYPAAPVAAGAVTAGNLLTDGCTTVKYVRAVSGLGTQLNYFIIAA